MRKFLRYLIMIFGIFSLSFAVFILWITLTDYKPPKVLKLDIEGEGIEETVSELTILTWNIGYAGLGAEMDFFYDGGKSVRPPKELVESYLKGILEFLKNVDADLILLQEVDKDSDRTYHIDEVSKISQIFPNYAKSFAINYAVKFVPVPITKPMGKVLSGQMIIGKYRPIISERYALPGKFPWPKNLFMLDRCFVLWKLKAPENKEWVILNIHNSAYDEGGIRKKQLDFIKDFIVEEYRKGNYVVVGGDWNCIFPNVSFETKQKRPKWYVDMPDDWIPEGWKLAYDPKIPTNRSVDSPYEEGKNFVTVIDGFLVSPNVKILEVKGIDLKFKYSDHNPVMIRVKAR